MCNKPLHPLKPQPLPSSRQRADREVDSVLEHEVSFCQAEFESARGLSKEVRNPFPLILNPPQPPNIKSRNIVPINNKREVLLLGGGGF